jgi:methyl-accepting chemotaxis protein
MRWFNNLNAKPRLMISFGVLLVLTLGISFLAISNLSKANDRVQNLYEKDMKGVIAMQNIAVGRMSVGRLDRGAIIDIENTSAVAEDKRSIQAAFTEINSNLQLADQYFYTKEGLAMIQQIREILPDYKRAVDGILDAVDAKDIARAKNALVAADPVSARLNTAINQSLEFKEARAEEKFQANNAAYQSSRAIMIGACLVSLILGVVLSLFIARSFSVPLGKAVDALERVAAGDLTASLDVETEDEVGHMATALNRAVERLCETMQEVADSASNASSSSQQLAAASEAIATGAQEQASSLEETSASLEEITATVRQSADNAQQASQLASGSRDSAEQGQAVVSKAITAMLEINASSAKIADIISTIDEIAFQTNLLAVNAAVEAARAGDEGRGFAMVASEVRSLAQRSAVNAKEIKVLIQDSLRKVEAGSDLVNRSGETLQGIVGSVKRVTDIVGEMAAAASEQSTGIEQVNTAMTQMDQVTQSNSAQTEELSATAQSLSEQAARLLELVSTFTLTNSGRSQRQGFHAQETPVGASLVQSAKASMAQGLSPSAHSSPAAQQRTAKAARGAAAAKPKSRATGKTQNSAPPAAIVAAAPSVSSGSDASFEEF